MCHLRQGEDLEKELAGTLSPAELAALLAAKHRPNFCTQVGIRLAGAGQQGWRGAGLVHGGCVRPPSQPHMPMCLGRPCSLSGYQPTNQHTNTPSVQVLTAAVREAQLPGAGPTSRDPTAAVPAGAAYRMDENITVFVVRFVRIVGWRLYYYRMDENITVFVVRWSCVGIVDVLRAAVVVGVGCRIR